MTGDGLATSHRPDVLSGLGLDVDRRLEEPEQPGQVGSHGRLVRSQLWFLGVDDQVAVDHDPARQREPIDDLGQEPGTVEPAPFRVGIRIVLADVSQSCRAEQGIGERMTDDISVGVPCQAPGVINPHTRQDQRPPLHQSMRVVPDPYSQGDHLPPEGRQPGHWPLASKAPETLHFAAERPSPASGTRPAPLRANSSDSSRFWLSLAATLAVVPFFPVEIRNLGKIVSRTIPLYINPAMQSSSGENS